MRFDQWYPQREIRAKELRALTVSLRQVLGPAFDAVAGGYVADPLTGLPIVRISWSGIENQPNVDVLSLAILGKPAVTFTPTSTSEGAFIKVAFTGDHPYSNLREIVVEGDSPDAARLRWETERGPQTIAAREFLRMLVERRLTL